MTVCIQCQHENQTGVQICDECGTDLHLSTKVPAVGDPEREASGSASYEAKIVIARGGTVGKEFKIEPVGETQIGRWDPDGGAFPEIDLTEDDAEAKISRKHARIFVKDGGYFVEDLGSLNGTFLNRGPRLLPGSPEALKAGDEVIMGKTFFKFLEA